MAFYGVASNTRQAHCEQYPPSPLPATSSTRILSPHFLSGMLLQQLMGCKVYQAHFPPRHNTHFEPSSLK